MFPAVCTRPKKLICQHSFTFIPDWESDGLLTRGWEANHRPCLFAPFVPELIAAWILAPSPGFTALKTA